MLKSTFLASFVVVLVFAVNGISLGKHYNGEVSYFLDQSLAKEVPSDHEQDVPSLRSQSLSHKETVTEPNDGKSKQSPTNKSMVLWQIILIVVGAVIVLVIVLGYCWRKNEGGSGLRENGVRQGSDISQRLNNQSIREIRTCIVVGMIGSGKTSFLNQVFSLKLPTGMGGCTEELVQVTTKGTNNKIYDSPGLSSPSAFNDKSETESYNFALDYDRIFLFFEDSLKPAEKFVRFANSKGKEVIFVRSKCDKFGVGQLRTVDEQMEVDRTLLRNWGVRNVRLYSTSANPTIQMDGNRAVKQLLLN